MIGYYVHHHGSGHRARYAAVASLRDDVVAISELEMEGGLRLPSDVPDGGAVDPLAGGSLHWAPLHADAARRLNILTAWLASRRPCGVVVDVSVEAAVACRLGGVRTVVVRQLGRRADRAHELGYRTAQRLVAPWPRELEDEAAPSWIREKTEYVGYVRDAATNRSGSAQAESLDVRESDVVVLWGRGGGRLPVGAINAIAANCRGTVWCIGTGVVQGDTSWLARNVAVVGWRTDIDSILCNSPVTVSSAGNTVIADAARWRCPLVLVPQRRPFAEQHVHARRLASLGAAVVVDGSVECETAWSARLRTARSCSARLSALYRPGAALQLAGVVSHTFGCR